MHVVEMSPYNNYFPKLLSSPNDPVYSAEETPNFNLVRSVRIVTFYNDFCE